MLSVLKEALQPSHREAAVAALAPMAAKSAAIRKDLCDACATDPAATVRAACVIQMMKYAPKDADVLAAVTKAMTDEDPRVGKVAKAALGK